MTLKYFKYHMTFPTLNGSYISRILSVLLKCSWRLTFEPRNHPLCKETGWVLEFLRVCFFWAHSKPSLLVWQADSFMISAQQLCKAFRYFLNVLTRMFRKFGENNCSRNIKTTSGWFMKLQSCCFCCCLDQNYSEGKWQELKIMWQSVLPQNTSKNGACVVVTILGLRHALLRSMGW